MPYLLTDYTANVYPTKLNEYLVMGIPVVATDLPEIRRFNAQHGDVVDVAKGADAFAASIRRALNPSTAPEIERRIAVAHENSWDSRIATMSGLIDEAIDRRAASKQGWDERLRRAYRRARTQIAGPVLAIAAMYLLVFHTNLVWRVAEPLKISAAPTAVDAIVVFAGGVGESGKAGGGAQERISEAIDLRKAGYARYLVLSSGYIYSFREAEVMRAQAVDQGVPLSDIVLEERATNTYENVKYVDEILHARQWKSIALVSSPYHMRRALMVWHKVDPDITVIPTPPPESQFYHHLRGASLEQIRGILQEYLAILGYWHRGWV